MPSALSSNFFRISQSSCAASVLALVLVAGCATGEPASADATEGGDTVDAGPRPDSTVSQIDGGGGCGAGGTVNACCGGVCPGIGATNGAPACEIDGCVFRCNGESYDVNDDLSDGCELTDSPTGNHTTGGAVDLGTMPCDDGSSDPNISGTILSHLSENDPPILGFDAASGAAPDQYKVLASGGVCVNDIVLSLAVVGAANASCYELSVTTSVDTYSCAGNCDINQGLSSYADNSNIVFTVRKTCPASTVTEQVTYTVAGHL